MMSFDTESAITATAPWEHSALEAGTELISFAPEGAGCRAESLVLARCRDAALELPKLRPVLAGRLAEEALHLAREHLGRDSSATLLPATLLAESHYEQGRIEEADSLLRFRIPAVRAYGTLECCVRAYELLAHISVYLGRRELALSLLRDARKLGEQRNWPRLVAMSWLESGLIHLEHGDLATATACIREVRQPMRTHLGLAELRISIAQGRYAQASEGLAQLSEDTATERSNPQRSLQLKLQLAAALAGAGQQPQARDILLQALQVGAAQGLCMIFADAGRRVRQLITELASEAADASWRDLLPYVQSLVRHFDRSRETGQQKRTTTEVQQALTQREGGILQLIAQGLSNKRIALCLDITPETVKTHTKNIFLKLAAQTRAQAVARAETLGII